MASLDSTPSYADVLLCYSAPASDLTVKADTNGAQHASYEQQTRNATLKANTSSNGTLTISATEYKLLVELAQEYRMLTTALVRYGITKETVQEMISSGYETEHGDNISSQGNSSFGHTCSSETSANDDEEGKDREEAFDPQPNLGRRSILIKNLSNRTTLHDMTGLIKGGQLFSIYMRKDRIVCVNFVSDEGAAAFFSYAKCEDRYLHEKRLEFEWSEKQITVPRYILSVAANGATRNLVIRGATGNLTEAQIREDLEHIHQLVIISLDFCTADAWISLNSIQAATYAKNCLLSRAAYKGMRIAWYPDQCAIRVLRPTLPMPLSMLSMPSMSPNPPCKPNHARILRSNNIYALLDDEQDTNFSSEEDYYFEHGRD